MRGNEPHGGGFQASDAGDDGEEIFRHQASDTGDDDYEEVFRGLLPHFDKTPRLRSFAAVDRLSAYKLSQPVAVFMLAASLLGLSALEIAVDWPTVIWPLYGVMSIGLIALVLASPRAAHLWRGQQSTTVPASSTFGRFLRPARPNTLLDFFWVASRSHRGWATVFWHNVWAPIWEELRFPGYGPVTVFDPRFKAMHDYRFFTAEELAREIEELESRLQWARGGHVAAGRGRTHGARWLLQVRTAVLLAPGIAVLILAWALNGGVEIPVAVGVLCYFAAIFVAPWNTEALGHAIRFGERRQQDALEELSLLVFRHILKKPLAPAEVRRMALDVENRHQCPVITDKLLAEVMRSAKLRLEDAREGTALPHEASPVVSDLVRARRRLWVVTGKPEDREAYDLVRHATADSQLFVEDILEDRKYSGTAQKVLTTMLKNEQRAFYTELAAEATPAATRARLATLVELAQELDRRTGEARYAQLATEYSEALERVDKGGPVFEPQ